LILLFLHFYFQSDIIKKYLLDEHFSDVQQVRAAKKFTAHEQLASGQEVKPAKPKLKRARKVRADCPSPCPEIGSNVCGGLKSDLLMQKPPHETLAQVLV
jgi:hypothetical protein